LREEKLNRIAVVNTSKIEGRTVGDVPMWSEEEWDGSDENRRIMLGGELNKTSVIKPERRRKIRERGCK